MTRCEEWIWAICEINPKIPTKTLRFANQGNGTKKTSWLNILGNLWLYIHPQKNLNFGQAILGVRMGPLQFKLPFWGDQNTEVVKKRLPRKHDLFLQFTVLYQWQTPCQPTFWPQNPSGSLQMQLIYHADWNTLLINGVRAALEMAKNKWVTEVI